MRISDWSSDVCSSDLHALNAEYLEPRDRFLCGRARRVHEPDCAQVAVADSHCHCSPALIAQALDLSHGFRRQRSETIPTEHLGLAAPDHLAIAASLYTLSGQA